MNLPPIIEDMLSVTQNMQLHDFVDILILSVVFYLILNMIRASRSQVALRGMLLVLSTTLVIYLVTIVAGLSGTKAVLDRLWVVIVLIYLIVFQNEFKKSLIDYGRLPFFRALFKQEIRPLEEVIRAAGRLSEKKVGALICFERRTPLRPYIDTGTAIDSIVSVELLRTIFAVYTPLHDGAVIIRNNRVAAAGCLLPLTQQNLKQDMGTRHRAAVGMAEETDAVVVVVSEETGIISIAHDGQISRPETTDTLRQKLKDLFEIEEEDDDGEVI